MKKNSGMLAVILLILTIILVHSCRKKANYTIPVITTTAVTEISYTTAVSGGDVTDDGGVIITARGVCWNTSAEPTIENSKTTETGGSGVFTSNLTGLTPGTMYYVRAYATNTIGTGYGNEVSFTTSQVVVPVLTTAAITSITQTTAVSGGNITADNGGSVTARGVCWSTVQNPTTSDSKTSDAGETGNFTSNITGLTGNTTYYVRAYATNSAGTAYGNELSFTTSPVMPTVTTVSATIITSTTATGGGNVTSDGGAAVTARGVCWSTTSNPTIALSTKTTDGTGTGAFTSSITGLTQSTTYYVKAYATNSAGTAYGNEVSFITSSPVTTVTDIEGNVYNAVTIGTQTWMAENLKTVKYNDGTDIPLVTDNAAWAALVTPGFCWYNNDAASYKATYGALYNWYSVNTGKLCPSGWHVPAKTEWEILLQNMGGLGGGGKLKETGTTHWTTPNSGATNESGFTALPGGYRYITGKFNIMGDGGYWWKSAEYNATKAECIYLYYTQPVIYGGYLEKTYGISVRCLKD